MSKSLYTTIIETTAPTTSTVGMVGQLYLDTSTKTLYQCVEVDTTTPSYTWKAVGGSRKYLHNIVYALNSGVFPFSYNIKIISNSNEPMTRDALTQWLFNNGYTNADRYYGIIGHKKSPSMIVANVFGIYATDDTTLLEYYTQQTMSTTTINDVVVVSSISASDFTGTHTNLSGERFIDTVTEI